MRLKSAMQHDFSVNPQANIPRSSFDRSFVYKTTFDAGYLIPWFVDEVVPGDTFNLRSTIFARLATPIAPIMDNMFLDTQFFLSPIVWFGIIGKNLWVSVRLTLLLLFLIPFLKWFLLPVQVILTALFLIIWVFLPVFRV